LTRATVATFVLLAVLLAARAFLDRRDAPRAARAGRRAAACFDVVGASRDPGLRCVTRPSVEDAAPAAPCGTAAARARIADLAARCDWRGKRLILAPLRAGGPCIPRLEPLPAAVRLALRVPLDLSTATLRDLEALPGVGPATARNIVDSRTREGAEFRLERVPGIGARRSAELAPLLHFAPGGPAECGGPP
jgi:competence protein ComEA